MIEANQNTLQTTRESSILPYSLTVKGASAHFGFAPPTIYGWISKGRLRRGVHFIKVAGKPLIIREAFIDWMRKEDGYGSADQG